MIPSNARISGHSLVELAAVLTLLAVGLSAVAPNARDQLDRASVVEARETIVGLVARSRMLAVRHGGARLLVEVEPARAWIALGDSTLAAVELPDGIEVRLGSSGREGTEIGFNGLGIGTFANETLELTRGRARTRLIVSSYGRVRRE